MRKNILFMTLLMCCVFTNAFAIGGGASNGGNLIEKCAEKIVNDKVYLKAGLACVAQQDIFLKVNESVIPIEAVYCDQDGVFVYDYQLGDLIECMTCRRFYNPKKQWATCPHRFKWED